MDQLVEMLIAKQITIKLADSDITRIGKNLNLALIDLKWMRLLLLLVCTNVKQRLNQSVAINKKKLIGQEQELLSLLTKTL